MVKKIFAFIIIVIISLFYFGEKRLCVEISEKEYQFIDNNKKMSLAIENEIKFAEEDKFISAFEYNKIRLMIHQEWQEDWTLKNIPKRG